MKNLIKYSLVIVVMFTAILGNANETFILRNLNDNKTTTLTLLDVEQGNQLLLIKDVDGFVLYKEKIQNSGTFTKGFNLTSLPDGKYYFELKKDSENIKISFIVKKKLVEYKKDKESTIKKALTESKKNGETNKTEKSVRQEKGLQRRVLNFKETYFNEYYNSKK